MSGLRKRIEGMAREYAAASGGNVADLSTFARFCAEAALEEAIPPLCDSGLCVCCVKARAAIRKLSATLGDPL